MSWYVKVGEGRDSWQFPDAGHEMVIAAVRRFRFAESEATRNDGLVLASVAEAMRYLLYTAPSTKAAVDKLAQMRKAIKAQRATPNTGERKP